jgi:hypothetical protein
MKRVAKFNMFPHTPSCSFLPITNFDGCGVFLLTLEKAYIMRKTANRVSRENCLT